MSGQIIKHKVDLDSVAFKAFINFPALYQIAQVREPVRVLDGKRRGHAALRYADPAERHLAEIAPRRRRGPQREHVLANGGERDQSRGGRKKPRNRRRTNSRIRHDRAGSLPLPATRDWGRRPDRRWAEGTSTRTGCPVCSAGTVGRTCCWSSALPVRGTPGGGSVSWWTDVRRSVERPASRRNGGWNDVPSDATPAGRLRPPACAPRQSGLCPVRGGGGCRRPSGGAERSARLWRPSCMRGSSFRRSREPQIHSSAPRLECPDRVVAFPKPRKPRP